MAAIEQVLAGDLDPLSPQLGLVDEPSKQKRDFAGRRGDLRTSPRPKPGTAIISGPGGHGPGLGAVRAG